MNKLFLIVILLLAVAMAWACRKGTDGDDFKSVGVDEFEKIISGDSICLLDVRTLSEYQEGHLQNALLIDFKTDSFTMAARDRLPKEKMIAVYCRSGRRSALAAARLAADGYQVVNMEGGIIAWEKAGKLIVKE
jgi:carboxyl-terminal processing protease